MKMRYKLLALLLAILLLCSGCKRAPAPPESSEATSVPTSQEEAVLTVETVPAYSGAAYVALKGNQPDFTEADMTTVSYESYSDLDALGRCGVTMACVGQDIMPTEDRGSIGQVKPTGWHTVKYDCVDGKYLYNRCHLIGYQLTGENANGRNLITGTRYLNIEGMLPFEDMVADYVKETGNHVLYRVTPVFKENNLLASGVVMEGWSVEDAGEGVCFHVYAYNVQPGVQIDYATGDSALGEVPTTTAAPQADAQTYILNTNSKKFHLPTCGLAEDIKESNRRTVTENREELIDQGYSPCKSCNP
ncbi:MAG: DNA/RNA non-specific endonuclease [Clostridia bacterium]|nr:DNA/RNA non-specific endonuclease [Clostridia bacterium]